MRRTVQGRTPRNSVRNVRRLPRNRKRPNYKLLVGAFLAAALVSGIISFCLQTPSLLVTEVRIAGVNLADKAKVRSAARIVLGRNIILVDKSEVISGIRRLPEVRQVRVGRTFPNRVWVRVWERRPDAIVVAGGRCCMIQLDGFAFHQTAGPVRGVPAIRVSRCGPLVEGRQCVGQDVVHALSVLACARKERLPVAEISVDPLGDMCLNMEGGFYVKLGQPDEIARKMSILRNTLACRPSIGRDAVYIDLSCPSAPVWKPKAHVAEAS